MVKDKLLPPLSDARACGLDWIEVARAMQAREAQGPGDAAFASPIRLAERESGYSANQLRRMLAGLAFLDELQTSEPSLRELLGRPRFSHCEMLAKIWRADRKALLDLLRRQPVLRYEALCKLFSELQRRHGPSPKAAGKRAASALQQRYLPLLAENRDWLGAFGSGHYTLLQPRVHHTYCKPTLLLCIDGAGGSRRWVGLKFVADFSPGDDISLRRLMLAATEASFLDALVICTLEDRSASAASKAIEDLAPTNLGVVVAIGQSLAWSRAPCSSPLPDRRNRWHPPRLLNSLAEFNRP